MSKELDDLLRDVFGSGRSRTISTQKAETYLEQSRRTLIKNCRISWTN